MRRRRDSNPQPRVKRRLASTELQYRSATPPEMLCEWRIGDPTRLSGEGLNLRLR